MAALLPVDVPWGQQKPPYGTQVNRAHPLLSEGGSAWLLNEGAGTTAYDSYANNGAVLQSGEKWATSLEGPSLYNTSSGSGWAKTPVVIPQSVAGFTIIARLIVTTKAPSWGLGSVGNAIFCQHAGADTMVFCLNTSNQLGLFSNTATSVGNSTALTYNTGDIHTAAVSFNNSTFATKFYWDGKDVSSTNNSAGLWSGGYSYGEIGSDQQHGNYFAGNLLLLAIWQRILSAADIQQLYANPYAFMQPRRVWVPGGAAAVTGGPWPWFMDELSGGLSNMGMAA